MANFHFQLIVPVSLLFNFLAECSAASASPEPLTAFPGKEVALSCLNSALVETSYRGRWIKKLTSEVIFEWPNESTQTEKVEWKADGDGNMCVFLKNLDQSDDGIYTEEVWKGWGVVQKKDIRLKIKDCNFLQPVKAAPGSTAKLQCETTSESSKINWEKLKGKKQVTTAENINGSLVFQSVNSTDGGWYRCTFKLRERQRCYDVNLLIQAETSSEVTTIPAPMTTTDQALEVTEPVPPSTSNPFVASIVIVTIIMTSALIALIIYFKSQTQRPLPQLRRQSPVYMDAYESIGLHDSRDDRKTVNSLYYCEEENISTFQY
ncbi:uncharacterized protein LOC112143883 isoform X1 [Oryzias melastigma]|uniref:uncharacterized protein LOC112143883 isoform X1 n=1 Tax=Oryzias melastigma TaxID=30732 RepID=UPI000CF7BA7F|nr:uncharacterized protein LOC112143883 isoform X1 [Oryzias melastigma]